MCQALPRAEWQGLDSDCVVLSLVSILIALNLTQPPCPPFSVLFYTYHMPQFPCCMSSMPTTEREC